MTDTTPHRATPDQWHNIDQYRKLDRAPDHISITLELAGRLAATEQRISELESGATCPHIVSSDEGTSYCGLAEQQAAATPPEPAPVWPLVEWVVDAIVNASAAYGTADEPACAAILAVAKWLDTKGQHGCSMWLREEVER